MKEATPLLQAENLSVGYGGSALLEHFNLGLYGGQLTCFMGPNGIGKSTLIRTLAGLQPALGGRVHFHPTPGQRARAVAVVLTDRVTAPTLRVRDLVAFGRYPYTDWRLRLTPGDTEQIERALKLTGTDVYAGARLGQLSDGQIQMALIARAIAQDCPVLLLDEPTAHLDLNNRVEIMALLRSLAHNSGKAVLLATHDLHLALQTADLIWLAGRKRNVRAGFPEDLVLQGAFDEIFQLKGFDLRTGRMAYTPLAGRSIAIEGEGAAYLWTRNALERLGFEITPGGRTVTVRRGEPFAWELEGKRYDSLAALFAALL